MGQTLPKPMRKTEYTIPTSVKLASESMKHVTPSRYCRTVTEGITAKVFMASIISQMKAIDNSEYNIFQSFLPNLTVTSTATAYADTWSGLENPPTLRANVRNRQSKFGGSPVSANTRITERIVNITYAPPITNTPARTLMRKILRFLDMVRAIQRAAMVSIVSAHRATLSRAIRRLKTPYPGPSSPWPPPK